MVHRDSSVPVEEVCDVSDLAYYSDVNDSDEEHEDEQRPYVAPPVTPQLLASILKQVEFYFSDANLPTDKKLLKQIKKEPNGYVPIKVFANFRKVRALTRDPGVIASAIKDSKGLNISEAGSSVRRVIPVPEYNVEDMQRRILVVENLPAAPTIEMVTEAFEQYGKIKVVRICLESKGKLPYWLTAGCIRPHLHHAYVEFEDEECAVEAAAAVYPQEDWRSTLVIKRLVTRLQELHITGEHRFQSSRPGSSRASRDTSPAVTTSRRQLRSTGSSAGGSCLARCSQDSQHVAAAMERQQREMRRSQDGAGRAGACSHRGSHDGSWGHEQYMSQQHPSGRSDGGCTVSVVPDSATMKISAMNTSGGGSLSVPGSSGGAADPLMPLGSGAYLPPGRRAAAFAVGAGSTRPASGGTSPAMAPASPVRGASSAALRGCSGKATGQSSVLSHKPSQLLQGDCPLPPPCPSSLPLAGASGTSDQQAGGSYTTQQSPEPHFLLPHFPHLPATLSTSTPAKPPAVSRPTPSAATSAPSPAVSRPTPSAATSAPSPAVMSTLPAGPNSSQNLTHQSYSQVSSVAVLDFKNSAAHDALSAMLADVMAAAEMKLSVTAAEPRNPTTTAHNPQSAEATPQTQLAHSTGNTSPHAAVHVVEASSPLRSDMSQKEPHAGQPRVPGASSPTRQPRVPGASSPTRQPRLPGASSPSPSRTSAPKFVSDRTLAAAAASSAAMRSLQGRSSRPGSARTSGDGSGIERSLTATAAATAAASAADTAADTAAMASHLTKSVQAEDTVSRILAGLSSTVPTSSKAGTAAAGSTVMATNHPSGAPVVPEGATVHVNPLRLPVPAAQKCIAAPQVPAVALSEIHTTTSHVHTFSTSAVTGMMGTSASPTKTADDSAVIGHVDQAAAAAVKGSRGSQQGGDHPRQGVGSAAAEEEEEEEEEACLMAPISPIPGHPAGKRPSFFTHDLTDGGSVLGDERSCSSPGSASHPVSGDHHAPLNTVVSIRVHQQGAAGAEDGHLHSNASCSRDSNNKTPNEHPTHPPDSLSPLNTVSAVGMVAIDCSSSPPKRSRPPLPPTISPLKPHGVDALEVSDPASITSLLGFTSSPIPIKQRLVLSEGGAASGAGSYAASAGSTSSEDELHVAAGTEKYRSVTEGGGVEAAVQSKRPRRRRRKPSVGGGRGGGGGSSSKHGSVSDAGGVWEHLDPRVIVPGCLGGHGGSSSRGGSDGGVLLAGAGSVTSEGGAAAHPKTNKTSKKDYAAWAAATPEYRAEASAKYNSSSNDHGGSSVGAVAAPIVHPRTLSPAAVPVPHGSSLASRASPPPHQGSPTRLFNKAVSEGGGVSGGNHHHIPSVTISKGPDGTNNGFGMGRGRPLQPPIS
ncbi:hypothetical protein CEUSTIGMA_g4579.t1 [Chlamydomonas eustigma]|uniref:HTH La-type RNA-binding domain-containing protein n=1 Tax=Chlamydomonas eustigma TaxID=1157962 RepID=A0A250X215_9CHLO|nr:hypothetical protein CEUSTIGMA_g4579.t1 [Chlamydomonas eustigma]|eukprot:GAX77133.1 hypothetical protein CEUSTIGMA_g4579.t1 [Chlamydomonas eustigma]